MVDKLRYKSEAELKMLYQRFFSDELKEEWRVLTDETDFRDAKEEDIIKAIQKNRYDLKDV
ncbi:hypothetical protein GCM10023143_34690 [Compostibacter hankyongensis]|uniref:Uncharacterized protein n=2 Tax=Compostibacter hankyongensis TaxID=1007089 RepID=A0ABP8GAK3_9BACT